MRSRNYVSLLIENFIEKTLIQFFQVLTVFQFIQKFQFDTQLNKSLH